MEANSIVVIDRKKLDELTEKAKTSPRLRMNLNFHHSLDEKCHRFLNAVEPGTEVPIHHHPMKDETFVLLRGRVRVITYNDEGEVIDNIILEHGKGCFGINIPKNVWHKIECLESGSIFFECKEGPFVQHEDEGVLEVNSK